MLTTLLYIVFVIAAIVLITVVLLQEGKGGGFGQALGDHGQQTFGVGAKGINTFTGYVAGTFVVTALLLHMLNRGEGDSSVLDSVESYTTLPEAVDGGAGLGGFPPPGGGQDG